MLSGQRKSWRPVVVALAAVVGVGVTARLGWWQLSRAQAKLNQQALIDERGRLPVLEVAALARDASTAVGQHQRRVRVQGQWVPAHTVFLDNRTMANRTGFFVVTPLQLADGSAVLVQRGWVPRNFQDRTATPQVPTPEGPVMVYARIAPPPTPLYALGDEVPGRIRQNLDLAVFSREIGMALRPLSLQQLDEPGARSEAAADGSAGPRSTDVASAIGLRRDWPVPATGVGKHHGYAFQWFALSALIAGLYVWFQIIRPRRA